MKERVVGDQIKHFTEINQDLYNDAAKSLGNFADTPLGKDELTTWKARFQSLVISRLHNTHDNNSYFQSISMTINSLQKPENKDEEMIVLYSALLVYDFTRFDKLPDDTPRYNKTVFMRLLLSHRTDQNQLGQTAQRCLDNMTLDAISQPILNTKLKLHNADRKKDCALLSDIALERIETETNQAQLILDTVVKAFIKQWGRGNNEYDTVDNLLQYSEQSRDYIFKKLYEENHPYITSFFTLYEAYKDQTIAPTDLVHTKAVKNGIQNLFEHTPIIQKIYTEMKEKIAHQQEQTRLEAEKQKMRAEQEELKKSQSETAEFYIRLLPDLKGRSFITTINSAIISLISENRLLTYEESAMLYDPQKMSASLSFNELSENISLFISNASTISPQLNMQLTTTFQNHYDRLLNESRNAYINAASIVIRELGYQYISSMEVIPNTAIISRYENFESLYNGLHKQQDAFDQKNYYNKNVFNHLFGALEIIRPKIKKIYETARKRIHEEKKENRQKLKKEYLLDEIEHKTEYLKTLYELHTGLDLHHIDVEALDEDGTTIGSVAIGLSQGLSLQQRQSLTLAQKLEFRNEKDLIVLEMGEDIGQIIQRFAMVDWVAPHEIAHLIDWASNHFTDNLSKIQIVQNKIEMITKTFDQKKQTLANKIITLCFKESIIDGIGFYCASEYGTSLIAHDQDEKERKQDIKKAFSTTMEIIKEIITQKPHHADEKSRDQITLLRMIAASQQISADQKTTALLQELFQQLNQETNLISDEQKNKLIAFFSHAFEGGKKFLKETIL